jgi:hypothetical protein
MDTTIQPRPTSGDTTVVDPPVLDAGARLGPYQIVAPVGAGGMGQVYRAHDARLGRFVAVKVLSDHLADDPEALRAFEREARSVAALSHPNIVALYDVGTEDGLTYAVSELLEGETLRARLDEVGPLSIGKALDYAIQIANGLAVAHENGIVHCDLKPENLFITREGRVKILDFGIARRDHAVALREDRTTTLLNRSKLVGTPGYIAPEQIVGEPSTAQSDLFAFGVLLSLMLTGQHPFKRRTAAETLTATLRDEPPPLGRTVPGLPAFLTRLVDRCLDKRPEQRPRSARDLAFYLETLVGQLDLPPAKPARLAPGTVKRLRTRALIASCGLLLTLVATTWGYVRVMAARTVTASVENDLARAQRVVTRVHQDRLARLALTARLVASFPDLKALFSTNAPTIGDFLLAYQQRNPGTPVLLALGADGTLLGGAGLAVGASATDARPWLSAVADSDTQASLVAIDGRFHHAASAVAESAGTVFGYVIAAAPVDAAFAHELREATQDELVLLSQTGLVATTLRGDQIPWRSLDAWRRDGGRNDRGIHVAIGAQRFAARGVPLLDAPPLSAIMVRSLDDAVEPFQRIQRGVVVIGLLAALGAVAASLLLARTIATAVAH